MQLQITHKIDINFKTPTTIEPQILRFFPFQMAHYNIIGFGQTINPNVSGICTKKDIVNNTVSLIWFDSKIERLLIDILFDVDTTSFNPTHFKVYPSDFLSLDFHYSRKRWPLLIPYLETIHLTKEIRNFGKEIYSSSNKQTLTFLQSVNSQIAQNFTQIATENSMVKDPSETFKFKRGSSSDLAWMMVNIFRSNGIATRLVSGYHYSEINAWDERHTWVQVYIPGPGWLGLDPCSGKLTDEFYIPVVAAPYIENTFAISGEMPKGIPYKKTEVVTVKTT